MEINFKFKIGEEAQYLGRPEVRLMVVNRTMDECPGGIQLKYICRPMCFPLTARDLGDPHFNRFSGVGKDLLVLNEFELAEIK